MSSSTRPRSGLKADGRLGDPPLRGAVHHRDLPLLRGGDVFGIMELHYLQEGIHLAKLYFKYGAMGSSKTATALITKYNYEERGMAVWLLKPAADDRDGASVIRSRVGLLAPADAVAAGDDLLQRLAARPRPDVIVVDECQFLAEAQIDQLRAIVDLQNIPVLCFGLRTDFQTRLFPGSRRLFELADSITEIKTICACGAKATVNARLDPQGYILTEGAQVELGGNERYLAMCHRCYMTHIREHKKVR